MNIAPLSNRVNNEQVSILVDVQSLIHQKPNRVKIVFILFANFLRLVNSLNVAFAFVLPLCVPGHY